MLNTLQHPTCCPFGGSLIAHLTARSFTTRPVVLFARWNATELPRSGEAFASPGRVVHSDRGEWSKQQGPSGDCRHSCDVATMGRLATWSATLKWPSPSVELLLPPG
jgi:hypothetical protein